VERFQEDDRLIELIQQFCTPDDEAESTKSIQYTEIARMLDSGRTAKQCRDRWTNYLRAGIKKGAWTVDEVELIKDMYSTFGPR
jgi:Myb-like DNA-binding domain